MPDFDASPASANDDLTPDPSFWGPDRPAPRRRRPPGIADRVTAAIPNRDARTAIAAVVAVLLVATVLVSYRASAHPAGAGPAPPAPVRHTRAAPSTPRRVVVHVAGAVTRPGVVTLQSGARVVDALDTAGGALANANLDALNLAARLRDGQQILVPAASGSTPTASTTPATAPTTPTTG